jgi:N-acylneuraminate cytidylyltransferase
VSNGVVAVIPARGGSKRIPRKNIREFCGKPMIAWSIEAAKSSGLFDQILVSTDDPEIAEVARAWGAEVPFSRPQALSDDYSGTGSVMSHATRWMQDTGWPVSAVCCIYATAPFIQADDIRRGFEQLNSGRWEYAIAATTYASPVYRAFKECADGGVEMLFPEEFLTRSQDLPEVLHDAAQFYWGRPDAWLAERPGLGKRTAIIHIPRWRVQDIDDDDDWTRAELMAPLVYRKMGLSQDGE